MPSTAIWPTGVKSGGYRLLAASSNKVLEASTYLKLLSASVTVGRDISRVGVSIVASPTLYGLYAMKFSAATTMKNIRLSSATNTNTFCKNQEGIAYLAATSGEYLQFYMGSPWTALGGSSNHRRDLLRKIVVWEE